MCSNQSVGVCDWQIGEYSGCLRPICEEHNTEGGCCDDCAEQYNAMMRVYRRSRLTKWCIIVLVLVFVLVFSIVLPLLVEKGV